MNDPTETRIAFAKALAAVQPVAKSETADTGKYKYKYVTLPAVLEEVKRALGMFKLTLSQFATSDEENTVLEVFTRVYHVETGDVLEFPPISLKMPPDAQALGSAITYLRRYALVTLFAMEVEDDDGSVATTAQRVVAEPTFKSQEEAKIRAGLGQLTPEKRTEIIKRFKEHFGANLADLPLDLHEEALEWFVVAETEVDEWLAESKVES